MMDVFVVDDSALIRERIDTALAELDEIEVVGATNDVQIALDMILILKPDVVILDIRLPNGNGINVLEKLKSEPASPLVIMFTAFPYPQYRQKCLQAGADYFFDKTTDFERLTAILETLRDETSLLNR